MRFTPLRPIFIIFAYTLAQRYGNDLVTLVPDLNSLSAILLNFIPVDFAVVSDPRTFIQRDAEATREKEKNGDAIRNGNGYLAKTKLDFYGGQVLIKFGKLEENLGERCRRLLLPSTPRISPCLPSPSTPTRSFSHFPLRMPGKLDK